MNKNVFQIKINFIHILNGIYVLLAVLIAIGVAFKDKNEEFELLWIFSLSVLLILGAIQSLSKSISAFIKKEFGKGILFLFPAIVVIVLFVIPNGDRDKNQDIDQCKSVIRGIQSSLELYFTNNKKYPDNLKVLIKEGYLQEKGDIDPWDNEIRYKQVFEKDGKGKVVNYLLGSNGRDGKVNTKDDIDAIINPQNHSFKTNK